MSGKWMRFDSPLLFFLMTLIAVHFAIRNGATLWSIQLYAQLMAVLTSAYLQWRMTELRVLRRAWNGALAGGLCVGLSAAVIAGEMLELLRRGTQNEYWSWSRDWPIFAIHLAIVISVGALIGAILSAPSASPWFAHKQPS